MTIYSEVYDDDDSDNNNTCGNIQIEIIRIQKKAKQLNSIHISRLTAYIHCDSLCSGRSVICDIKFEV